MSRRHYPLRARLIRHRLLLLIRQPLFIWMSIAGNGGILLGATVFYFIEKDKNPLIESYLDCVAWAIGMVTTIGYGVHPVTLAGKVITILMMMAGAVFIWSYMALFVSALVSPELGTVENEIKQIETNITELKREVSLDEATHAQLNRLLGDIQNILDKTSTPR